MAKAKKTTDTLSSRLALVMKSGKGMLLRLGSHYGIQIYPQDPPLWQGQAHPHCWKLPTSAQVGARVLCYAC
ncbi:hypothetical protein HL42_7018 [Trichophyton rubrum]|nr:hypothetical protein HL42_7018 [Trichophyton rubrum]